MRIRTGGRDVRIGFVVLASILATGCAVSSPLRVTSETLVKTAFLYLTWFRG
jgi:hypothetical protein